jgi:hypothetical protein
MLTVHIIAAVLASWRLTELLTLDTGPGGVFAKARKSFPVFLGCARCVSVWAGLLCCLALCFLPWVNWPLALSQTYLISTVLASVLTRKTDTKNQSGNKSRELVVAIDDGQISLRKNEWSPEELKKLGQLIG